MNNIRLIYLILLLLLHSTVVVRHALASPVDDFNAGIKAFQQNQYQQALQFFLKAESGGINSAQLNYNLASVYYKLEQYHLSRRYFETLLANPVLEFQAQYSLALIEHKTGNRDGAIELFKRSIKLTKDPRLIALVRKQIDTLSGLKSSKQKNWFVYLSPAYGYDSNISNTPSSNATDVSGSFLQALIYSDIELNINGNNNLHLTFTHLSKDYQDNNDFNLSTSILGIEYRSLFSGWSLNYGLDLGRSSYAGNDYLSQETIKVASTKRLNSNRDLRLAFRYENVSSLSRQFEFLDGDRTDIKAEYRFKKNQQKYGIIYQLELNDRRDTDTLNFSPTRHLIGTYYEDNIREKFKAGFKLDYRDSDYESTSEQNRRDKRTRLGINGHYQLSTEWAANLEVLFTRNQSTEQASDYRSQITTLSFNALF